MNGKHHAEICWKLSGLVREVILDGFQPEEIKDFNPNFAKMNTITFKTKICDIREILKKSLWITSLFFFNLKIS